MGVGFLEGFAFRVGLGAGFGVGLSVDFAFRAGVGVGLGVGLLVGAGVVAIRFLAMRLWVGFLVAPTVGPPPLAGGGVTAGAGWDSTA